MSSNKIDRPRWNPKWVKDWQAVFCARIENGRSACSICLDMDMPAWSTVKARLAQEGEFSTQYARACEARADAICDEMLEIADNGSNDWIRRNDQENLRGVLNGENVLRSRLRVDARKWLLARLAPKKYVDSLAVNATVSVDELTEEQKLDKLITQLPARNVVPLFYFDTWSVSSRQSTIWLNSDGAVTHNTTNALRSLSTATEFAAVFSLQLQGFRL
jgi:hypothetical protein